MNCKVCHSLSGKNPNLSFFRFPSNYNRCKEWARLCNISHIFEKYGPDKFYKSFRICSDHFDSKYMVFDGRKKKLLNYALPNDCQKMPHTNDNFTLKLLRSLCRFCAEENTDLTDIFSWKGRALKLEEKIKVFPININKFDKLPLKICNQCIVKICKFHDFVKNCMRADMRLKTILGVSESVDANETFECPPDDKEKANTQNNGSDLMTAAEPVKDSPHEYVQNKGFGKSVSTAAQSTHQSESIDMFNNKTNSILNKYTCQKCFKTFSEPEIMKSHANAHSLQPDEHGTYKCRFCNKIFWNKYRLNEHNRTHTGECPFKCSKCHKKFHRMALLKQHLIIHESKKRFICSVCNLRSSRKGNLIQHLKTHYNGSKNQKELGQESFAHDICISGEELQNILKTTKGPSDKKNFEVMQAEVKIKSGLCEAQHSDVKCLKSNFEKHSWKCRNCQRDFQSEDSKPDHECEDCSKKRAEQGRMYRCEECGVRFKRKDTLINHMRIHTGERPFVCRTCGFAFKQKGDCVKHERNHNKKMDNG